VPAHISQTGQEHSLLDLCSGYPAAQSQREPGRGQRELSPAFLCKKGAWECPSSPKGVPEGWEAEGQAEQRRRWACARHREAQDSPSRGRRNSAGAGRVPGTGRPRTVPAGAAGGAGAWGRCRRELRMMSPTAPPAPLCSGPPILPAPPPHPPVPSGPSTPGSHPPPPARRPCAPGPRVRHPRCTQARTAFRGVGLGPSCLHAAPGGSAASGRGVGRGLRRRGACGAPAGAHRGPCPPAEAGPATAPASWRPTGPRWRPWGLRPPRRPRSAA